MWETKNPVNYVYNSTPKDDPPPIPTNRLYVVNTELMFTPPPTVPRKYNVTLNMQFPSSENPQDWLCAVFWGAGDKVPGSDIAFNASGQAIMLFDHYPVPTFADSKVYQVMVGKDANLDGLLNSNEASYVRIPGAANSIAEVEVHNYEDYGRAAGTVDIIACPGRMGPKHAACRKPAAHFSRWQHKQHGVFLRAIKRC